MKIALKFHFFCLKDSREWLFCLLIIQSRMNNFIITLDKTLNEIVYEFISIQSIDFTHIKNTSKLEKFFTFTRKQVVDVVAWTQMTMKFNYDRKHQSLNMKVDEYALLRLHKDYFISSFKILEKKLSQQYVSSFKILEKIENLIYRLNISQHWRIHSVVFVTQLESVSDSSNDSYTRFRFTNSDSIYVKEDIINVKSFEVNRLINKRVITREFEYLLRWKDYDSEHDVWRTISKLENAKDLILNYETFMNNVIILSERLSRITSLINDSTSSTIVSIISSNNPSQTNLRRSIRERKSRERD
jgi:hypothetical protein